MKEKIKIICLILITLSLLSLTITVGYLVWYKYTGDPIERCKRRCGCDEYCSSDKSACVKTCVIQIREGASD